MRSNSEVARLLVYRLEHLGSAQVEGYNRFGFIKRSANAVTVSREAGKDTRIPIAKIEAAVAAVRAQPAVYEGGPVRLRAHGLTHITSPLWAILHLAAC